MISTLRGVLLSLNAQSLVVDVHGVGMKVFVPARTSAVMRTGEEVTLHTTLIVREDDLSLYGFSAAEERDTFDLLCSVNGVGPKSALGVLNEMSVDDIAHAVASDNDQAFKAVSGIGPKTAKLIALSLQGKIAATGPSVPKASVENKIAPADHTAIVQALVGLGWSEKVAKKGVSDMIEQLPEGADSSVAALVKRALQLLGPQTSREDFS